MNRATFAISVLLCVARVSAAESQNDGARAAQSARQHWAFQPIHAPQPPSDPTGWARNPIDQFVHARLRAEGLRPVADADRRTLIRRLSFDLLGLPPTPDQVRSFTADDGPRAVAKVVDRMLASPHHGERWGRYWMDLVRYADTAGDNADYPVPEARRYRDYIIDAFSADKPFDAFVREQLAGDILADEGPRDRYAERVIATGFLALTRRYATAPFELWHLSLEDTVDTVGQAFLGLSLRCARCHDHKNDPVTMEDYYGLYGIFAATTYPYAGSEEFTSKKFSRRGFVPLLPPEAAEPILVAYREKVDPLRAEIKRIEEEDPLALRIQALDAEITDLQKQMDALGDGQEEAGALRRRQQALREERDGAAGKLEERLKPKQEALRKFEMAGLPPDLPGAYAVRDGKPVETHIHKLGNPADPGPRVERSLPRFLAGERQPHFPGDASGRRELADWLASPDNPLTARVMVNRIWQHHFGRGIVATPSNFGMSGAAPTHPELLDWLTVRFIESGWSVKAVHRLITESRTYRLASLHDAENAARDPDNRLYWRHDRRRLDAEAIRDAMLVVGGNLDRARPRVHPFPPVEQWGWTQHNPFKAAYPSRHRSVYLMTQRLQRHPYLALFDGPDTNTTTGARTRSTVPLQALFLINNPFVQAQAEGFARRLVASAADATERIVRAHETALGRRPDADEVARAATYVAQCTDALERAGVPDDRVDLETWTGYARVILTANEFVYLD